MTIGIPQALSYHYYHAFWREYFETLGFKVINSGPTNRNKLDAGIRVTPSEACLPLKCYFGHVLSLLGKADYIFVPRLVCMKKTPGIRLGCPKLIGLPDMVKALVPEANILTMDIDLRKEDEETSYMNLAQKLGKSKHVAQQAFRSATAYFAQHKENTLAGMRPQEDKNGKFQIGLLGHAYLLHDDYLNLGLIEKMLGAGASVISCHDLDAMEIDNAAKNIIPQSWYFEERILSAAYLFYHDEQISGIIYLLSFGCGAGSITNEIIDYELRGEQTIPFLRVILDEHTGETGLMTRLESFLDMIRLKKEKRF